MSPQNQWLEDGIVFQVGPLSTTFREQQEKQGFCVTDLDVMLGGDVHVKQETCSTYPFDILAGKGKKPFTFHKHSMYAKPFTTIWGSLKPVQM